MNSPEQRRARRYIAPTLAVAVASALALSACTSDSDAKPASGISSPESTGSDPSPRHETAQVVKGICGIALNGSARTEYGKLALGRAEDAIHGFEEKGMPRPAAQAIAATMLRESCINPNTTYSSGAGDVIGMGSLMWAYPGQRRLESYATKHGADAQDLATQVSFVVEDLRANYPETLADLEHAKNVEDASAAFVSDYLRPPYERKTVHEVATYAQMLADTLPQ